MNILLVDDEPDVRTSLARFIRKLGFSVDCAANGEEGLDHFHLNDYDLIITDIRMPQLDGVEFLRRIKQIENSDAEVIMITGHGDMDNAVKSLKYGAYDYLQKPIDVRDLDRAIKRFTEMKRLAEATSSSTLRQASVAQAESDKEQLVNLKVYSEAMRKVVQEAEDYSWKRAICVLVEGETGTGKELVARHIHSFGEESERPFVAINCGAVAENLFESELFGHEAGAYTGARSGGQKGKLEMAQGGTLFLDEIGELRPNVQTKLLRAIENKRFYRVGGNKEITVDVRIISATNKNLKDEVSAERFRADLFYRINNASIRIPPLRDRKDDIVPLAVNFLQEALGESGDQFKGFSSEAKSSLKMYNWPGNVRELRNAMITLSLRECRGLVEADDLAFITDGEAGVGEKKDNFVLGNDAFVLPSDALMLEQLNLDIIRQALEKNKGNVTKTAMYLGISRRVLQGRMKKLHTFK